jgi:hypothetical protein
VLNRPAVEAGLAVLDAGGDCADGVIAYEGTWLGGETFISFDKKAVGLLSTQGHKTRLLRRADYFRSQILSDETMSLWRLPCIMFRPLYPEIERHTFLRACADSLFELKILIEVNRWQRQHRSLT